MDRTRRDAIARNLCARICRDDRSERDLRQLDRELTRLELDADDQAKVYIAAAAGETERVARAIAAARGAGLEVVCTWPEVIAKVGDANPRGASVVDRFGWSSQDLAEVDQADVLWFLVPTPPVTTRGAWVEVGLACALGKHLVFSGDTKQSVFCALGEEFEDDELALSHIVRLAKGRAAMRRINTGLAELVEATGP
jgi:nucleoside 2-deoxyribosyltransferase